MKAFSIGVHVSFVLSRALYIAVQALVLATVQTVVATPDDDSKRRWVWFNGEVLQQENGEPYSLTLQQMGDVRDAIWNWCTTPNLPIYHHASVVLSPHGHLMVFVDDGRPVRPIQCMPDNTIRYFTAADTMAAPMWNPVVSLRELHPVFMLGSTALMIPFIQCNQSPRNTYQSSMGRQALPGSACVCTVGGERSTLLYAQKPLCPAAVPGTAMHAVESEQAPGMNFLVAVCPFTGDNQNDSVVFNRSSIERGLGLALHINVVARFDVHAPFLPFAHPYLSPHPGTHHKNELGVILPGTPLRSKMLLLATRATRSTDDTSKVQKADIRLRWSEEDDSGVVHRVTLVRGTEGYDLRREHPCVLCIHDDQEDNPTVKHVQQWLHDGGDQSVALVVRIYAESLRVPRVGDKFASRHGQKGTIGAVVCQADMPFAADGMVPDIVFNSHGIPSRMTMGQLWEHVVSQLTCIEGYSVHGSNLGHAFADMQGGMPVLQALRQRGQHTRMVLHSPITAEPLQTPVFCGYVYYQRLRHMVQDKYHVRATGPVNQLTRQPTEGRARQGGLRIGEMERDDLIATGAVGFMRERLLWNSDAYRLVFCQQCGFQTVAKHTCGVCRTESDAASVVVPFTFKLVMQEMAAMGIYCRIDPQVILQEDAREVAESGAHPAALP